ncbi:non-ribosomal peptide synthetase family protein [Actinophytocola sediminis]
MADGGQPAGPVVDHDVSFPGDLPAALVVAAHATVVGLLGGDRQVRVGCRVGTEVLTCQVDLADRTWRELVEHVGAALAELGVDTGDPACETVLPDGVVLGLTRHPAGLTLRCRAEPAVAARIAGYHGAALRAAVREPDLPHHRSCLLAEEELRFQLGELAGRDRDLPDRRWHDLFADQVRDHPDLVAVVFGERRLTYGDLDRAARRVTATLLDRGAGPEDVVAVCAERHLDWAAAVVGVLRAGCVYLPVDPGFPPARVTAMLTRADCRLVLTDQAGRAAVTDAVTDTTATVLPLDASAPGDTIAVPDIAVPADRAAYIYFTSGSTGEPKGAVCEHAGMLNHLLAKVEDLGIARGVPVAQTAPQCFDISLWQLLAPLLVGGSSVLVPHETQLDIGRFVDELAANRIEVLQVVPSYLDILLGELARRALPALRVVSATGEALKPELVDRWFATCPATRLVNAYGATEASDDTTHEVLTGPLGGRVPLGRPVPGARVLVVDEHLMPVPLGAPGEIVFAGVCVGRGYVNDPERTRAAFVPDPHRPGERLYRSGDFGRWAPDGRLEFLGRRDHQVKIRGFRVELAEIEDRLLRVPGVREAAVIVAGNGAANPSLVGCYAGPPSVPVRAVRSALASTLPDYMVPAHLFWLDRLPLTENGKVDRTALATITGSTAEPVRAPVTPAEWRVARAWAAVLGLPVERVDREHRFYDQGGTSLSALRLTIALDGGISVADITRHPVLADLATVLAGEAAADTASLHRLSPPGERGRGVLVCFPHAGGNAVNYLPLADALRGRGLAVHAVEPTAADVPTTAETAAGEIAALGTTPVFLWGHSAGTAGALATARLLRDRGHAVARVFLSAQLPGDAVGRLRSIDRTGELTDARIVAELSAESGLTELAGLDDRNTTRIASAYRRDSDAADRYFAGLLADPPAPLDVPVTVVLAADDPSTPEPATAHLAWRALAARVDLHELADGGHYFLTTRPAELARVVTAALAGRSD